MVGFFLLLPCVPARKQISRFLGPGETKEPLTMTLIYTCYTFNLCFVRERKKKSWHLIILHM